MNKKQRTTDDDFEFDMDEITNKLRDLDMDDMDSFIIACKRGDTDKINSMYQRVKYGYGQDLIESGLMYAAKFGHFDAVDKLVTLGARNIDRALRVLKQGKGKLSYSQREEMISFLESLKSSFHGNFSKKKSKKSKKRTNGKKSKKRTKSKK
jgi:hypothetical protein